MRSRHDAVGGRAPGLAISPVRGEPRLAIKHSVEAQADCSATCSANRAKLDPLLTELRPQWNLVPPHSLSGIGRSGGAIMRHIIYCALLIATWMCSTASVVWV